MASLRPVLTLLRDTLVQWHARRLDPMAPPRLVLSIATKLADIQRRKP